jgi:hypothetical protein
MKRLLMAWASVILLGACVATTPRIEEARLGEVRAGTTSYPQIVKHFGTPSLLSKNPDGTSFATYIYADPGAKGNTVVPLVAGVHRDSVTFYFDARGLLADVKMTSRSGAEARLMQETVDASPTGAVAATGAASTTSTVPAGSTKPRGWIWRLPDWLPAAPRENR